MGLLRFVVSPPDRVTDETAQQAYLSGIDGIPWLVRRRLDNGELLLERSVSDSANLHLQWDVPGHGRLALTSASLMERAAPYQLPLELARGKLSQLRNQLAEWQLIGLAVPDVLHVKAKEAVHFFSQAAVGQQDRLKSAEMAELALRTTLDATNMLAGCYTEQALAVRRRAGAKLPTALGAELGTGTLDDNASGLFLQAFNAACIPLGWRNVEGVEGNHAWGVSDQQVQWSRATACGPMPDRWSSWTAAPCPTGCTSCKATWRACFPACWTTCARRYRGIAARWTCGSVPAGSIRPTCSA